MKKQPTLIDEIFGGLIKLVLCVIVGVGLLFAFSSTDIQITVHKKKNSIIKDVGNVVDGSFGIAKAVKGLM